jgi:hypothetical protein
MTERVSQPRSGRAHRTKGSAAPGRRTGADHRRPCTQAELDAASTRELARRQTGALEVALFWHTCTDTLSVSVRDANGGADFRLEVDATEAMDVFHHPYAYAASRGIRY